MGKRIKRSNFKTIDGKTYSFDMDDHLNHEDYDEDYMLNEICDALAKHYKNGVLCELVIRIWTRDRSGIRINCYTELSPQNNACLYKYLDEESKNKGSNYLVWKKKGSQVTITVFGPLKDGESPDGGNCDRILRSVYNKLESLNDKTSEKEKQTRFEEIKGGMFAEYSAAVQGTKNRTDAKEMELKKLIYRVYDKPEDKATAEDLVRKLTASPRKTMIKTIIAEITAAVTAKIAKKPASRIAVKTTTKAAAGKFAVKGAPFVGVGFGIWRLSQGDLVGAGMEVASGIAACVPLVGTAVSLAIDVGLMGKDLCEAIAESKQHAQGFGETERIQRELTDLCDQLDEAEAEYEYLKDVLEDPGLGVEKLEREISALEKISLMRRPQKNTKAS